MFNALKYIKSLEAVGFVREQAEAQVQLVLDAIEEEVATKSDISEIRSDFAILRSDVISEVAKVKTDIAEFKADVSGFKNEIVFKLGALIVTGFTLATGLIGFLLKF